MKRPLPPTYLLVTLAVVGISHFTAPLVQIIAGAWRFVGLAPLFVGVALNIAADNTLKAHSTTAKPFQESDALVTSGVFGFSRNPMYLGMILILSGVALLAGSVTCWVAVLLFAVIVDRRFVTAEERMLEQKFAEDFRQYKQRIRRWI